MFGVHDVPLLPHAMLAEVQSLTEGHVALGLGRVDPARFTVPFAGAMEFHL